MALLCETWRSASESTRIPNFNLIELTSPISNNGVYYGGVAIAIRSDIFYSQIPISFDPQPFQIVGCSIEFGDKRLCLFSIYVAPNKTYRSEVINKIFEELIKLSSNYIIIAGDFNAHNPVWGDLRTDAKGLLILDAVDRYNLCFLNDGSFTRFKADCQPSAIDLTMVTPSLMLDGNWSTFNDTLGSDHVPIHISFRFNSHPARVIRNLGRISTPNKFNVCKFQDHLSSLDLEIYKDADPSTSLDALSEAIVSAFRNKNLKPKPFRVSPIWWTQECGKIVALRRKAFSKYKNCPNRENFL